MPAFEELGVCPEILRVFEQIEWYLPTTVQDETIPLLLGGGDVLVAAETVGSFDICDINVFIYYREVAKQEHLSFLFFKYCMRK